MVSRLSVFETYCPNRSFPTSCFRRTQVFTTFSPFARARRNVSVGDPLKTRKANTYNHLMATGNVADWDAEKYSKDATFVFKEAAPLLDLLNPQPGERILDVGCGSGELTKVIKDAGSTVLGTDASPSMVEASNAKGLDARVLDGHDLDFKEEFDAVFSNMALHWMKKDPRLVAKNIYNSLKKGGRFVAEFPAEGSSREFLEHGMPILKRHGILDSSPYYFPSKEEYADLLKSEGFDVQRISFLPRQMVVPGGIRPLVGVFLARFLVGVDEAKKGQIMSEIEEAAQVSIDDKGNCIINTFILTVAAIK